MGTASSVAMVEKNAGCFNSRRAAASSTTLVSVTSRWLPGVASGVPRLVPDSEVVSADGVDTTGMRGGDPQVELTATA